MSRYLRFSFLLFIGILVACSSSMKAVPFTKNREAMITSTAIPLPIITLSPISKETIIPTLTAISVTPTKYITPTHTAVLPDNLQESCLSIAKTIPSTANLKGTLILSALGHDERYFWNFSKGTKQSFPDTRYIISTSPDGNWMVSVEERGTQVFFRNVDGDKVRKYYKSGHRFTGMWVWINNDSLAFDSLGDPRGIPLVTLITPVTNEQRQLLSNYPDMKPYAGPGRIEEHFIYSSVVYDPTLKYVVYPKTVEPQHSIVLWDRGGQKALAELADEGNFYHNPVWAPDGNQVYVVVKKNATDEIFRINLNGEIRQLTEFGKAMSGLEIGSMSLSPDGKRLAFWESAKSSGVLQELAMIDLETQKVVDYCVPATQDFGQRPIWSPDSRFIAVRDYKETNHVRAILIDTQDRWAAEIDQVYPSGWAK